MDRSAPKNQPQSMDAHQLQTIALVVIVLLMTFYLGHLVGQQKIDSIAKLELERVERHVEELDRQLKATQTESSKIQKAMVQQSIDEQTKAAGWAGQLKTQLSGELERISDQHSKCLKELQQIARHRTAIPVTSVRKFVEAAHQDRQHQLTELKTMASEQIKVHKIATDELKRFATIDDRPVPRIANHNEHDTVS